MAPPCCHAFRITCRISAAFPGDYGVAGLPGLYGFDGFLCRFYAVLVGKAAPKEQAGKKEGACDKWPHPCAVFCQRPLYYLRKPLVFVFEFLFLTVFCSSPCLRQQILHPESLLLCIRVKMLVFDTFALAFLFFYGRRCKCRLIQKIDGFLIDCVCCFHIVMRLVVLKRKGEIFRELFPDAILHRIYCGWLHVHGT